MEIDILQPKYMSRFSCIGPACEDTCCHGWTVPLDPRTYQAYQACDNAELKPLFEKHIQKLTEKVDSISVAQIMMDDTDEKNCPFLDQQGLCNIHSKLGEEALSVTCFTFPRYANQIDGHLEISADLGCPEIARLVLGASDAMEFENVQISGDKLDKLGIRNRIVSTDLGQRYALATQMLNFFKDKSFRPWQKMAVFSMINAKGHDQIDDQWVSALPDFNHPDIMSALKQDIMKVPGDAKMQYDLSCVIADMIKAQGLTNNRFNHLFSKFSALFSGTDSARRLYQSTIKGPYRLMQRAYPWLITNYLLNYLFRSLYPCRTENIREQGAHFITIYLFFRTTLIGRLSLLKEDQIPDLNLLVDHIYSFSRSVEHATKLLNDMKQQIINRNMDQPSILIPLLKE